MGAILGENHTNLGTYISTPRPDGTLFGEGQGVVMTENGETATWKGRGVGRFSGQGSAVSWRGALYFQTASQQLSRLNSVAVIYEFDVDADRNTSATFFEWK